MNEEYIKFVEFHNINRQIAEEVYIAQVIQCNNDYGSLATPKVIGRNALFQLRILTGIKN